MAAALTASFAGLAIARTSGAAASPTNTPAAAPAGSLRSSAVIALLTSSEIAGLPAALASSVFNYMALHPLQIREDFRLQGRCSQETLTDLTYEGQELVTIDLSGIILGHRHPRCTDPETDDHVDTNFVHTCLSTANPEPFVELFSRCPNLTTLNLAHCNVNDAVVATLPPHLPLLRGLDLSGNKAISSVGLQSIAHLQEIRTLCLRAMARDRLDADTNICFFGCSIDSDSRAHTRGILYIKQFLKLEVLDLSGNYLDGGTTFLDTDLQLESCLPELLVCMNTIQTLQKIILNNCSDLFLEQIEELRAKRPRPTIEIVSNATPLETA